MKVLIIGGSGFIGSRLISECPPTAAITVFDLVPAISSDTPFILGDVRDPIAVANAVKGQDVILLLAAQHRDDIRPSSLYYETNVTGTKNVLSAMSTHRVKSLIFTSSVAVYGTSKCKILSNSPTCPQSHYGKSKLEAESLIAAWHREKPRERVARVVRPTVVFGEGNRGNAYKLFQQIWNNKFVMVGAGNNKKSMAYVGNIAAFLSYLVESSHPGITTYVYTDPPDLTMNQLVEHTRKLLGKRGRLRRVPYFMGLAVGLFADVASTLLRQSLPISTRRIKKFCASTEFESDAAKLAGFVAPYTLTEGIQNTLKHEFLQPRNI